MKTRWTILWVAAALLLAAACDDPGNSNTGSNPDDPANNAQNNAQNNDINNDGNNDANNDVNNDDNNDTNNDPDRPLILVDADEALESVNVFVGTGGYGFGYSGLTPAAQVPHGLVKLGPDTTRGGAHPPQNHFGGYNIEDPDLRGMSHLHFVGTGAGDYGNLRVLPTTEEPQGDPATHFEPMDKDSEQAQVGYYRVDVGQPDARITAEVSATLRGGFHRYTFPQGTGGHILMDLAASVTDGGIEDGAVTVTPEGAEGWLTYKGGFVGRTQPFTLYFSATVDPPAAAARIWSEGQIQDETQAEGPTIGATWRFDDDLNQPVVMRVGVSLVDEAQARAHREQELDGKTLEDVRAQAEEDWKALLGKVRIAGASDERQEVFYTALYNAYRMPTRFDGADGRYRGLDNEIHQLEPGQRFLSDLSLWDSFRTTHPWYTLVNPETQRDSLSSLMLMYEQRGRMPRWPAALSFTGSMIGSCADMLFAEGLLKGIDGIDYETAFDALLSSNFGAVRDDIEGEFSRAGAAEYIELGYLPADIYDESVSITQEYALSDGSLANMADALGRPEAQWLRQYSRHWRNLFDDQSTFSLPRNADGTFWDDVNLRSVGGRSGPYTEGSAWHWRFYTPHDGPGLVESFGGPEALATELEAFFEGSDYSKERINTALPNALYWHGNQPPLHTVFFFHDAQRPDRLAHWVRQIQLKAYTTLPDGLPGNDDGGTLSSWYLFTALGLYPIVGSDRYYVTPPLFRLAEVDLADGTTLRIEAPEATEEEVFNPEAVLIGDQPVQGGILTHDQLSDTTLFFGTP